MTVFVGLVSITLFAVACDDEQESSVDFSDSTEDAAETSLDPNDGDSFVDSMDATEHPGDSSDRSDSAEYHAADHDWKAQWQPACEAMSTAPALLWFGDPNDLTQVPVTLNCLNGDGSLTGTYVSRLDVVGWSAVESADNRFEFPLSDLAHNEVHAFYDTTGLAGYLQAVLPNLLLSPISIVLDGTMSVTSSLYEGASSTVTMGLTGTAVASLHHGIFVHEVAHHATLQVGADIDQVVREALADYLSADFRDDSAVVHLEDLSIGSAMQDEPTLMELARRYFDRNCANTYAYPDDEISQEEFCAAAVGAAGGEASPEITALVEHCESLSEQELAAPEPHLTGRILAGALWRMRQTEGPQLVLTLIFDALGDSSETRSVATFATALVEHPDSTSGISDALGIHGIVCPPGLGCTLQP